MASMCNFSSKDEKCLCLHQSKVLKREVKKKLRQLQKQYEEIKNEYEWLDSGTNSFISQSLIPYPLTQLEADVNNGISYLIVQTPCGNVRNVQGFASDYYIVSYNMVLVIISYILQLHSVMYTNQLPIAQDSLFRILAEMGIDLRQQTGRGNLYETTHKCFLQTLALAFRKVLHEGFPSPHHIFYNVDVSGAIFAMLSIGVPVLYLIDGLGTYLPYTTVSRTLTLTLVECCETALIPAKEEFEIDVKSKDCDLSKQIKIHSRKLNCYYQAIENYRQQFESLQRIYLTNTFKYNIVGISPSGMISILKDQPWCVIRDCRGPHLYSVVAVNDAPGGGKAYPDNPVDYYATPLSAISYYAQYTLQAMIPGFIFPPTFAQDISNILASFGLLLEIPAKRIYEMNLATWHRLFECVIFKLLKMPGYTTSAWTPTIPLPEYIHTANEAYAFSNYAIQKPEGQYYQCFETVRPIFESGGLPIIPFTMADLEKKCSCSS